MNSGIAIYGMGRMGYKISEYIKVLSPKNPLYGFDINKENLKRNNEFLDYAVHTSIDTYDHDFEKDPIGLMISALPFHMNLPLAKACINRGINYVDLGGNVHISKEINEYSINKKKCSVFTDLGLAPGWVNIMAEEAYRELGSETKYINMYCGGIPARTRYEDPFNYFPTWSEDGLYNEYVDEVESLHLGQLSKYSGLSALHSVKIVGSEYEAARTSGGISHTLELMYNRGVKNCEYYTLRYPGHFLLAKYFIFDKGYTANQFANLLREKTEDEDDMVIIHIDAAKGNLSYDKTHVIYASEDASAMQKATAAGLVAAIISVNGINGKYSLNYSNVNIDLFNENIEKLEVLW